MSPPGEHLAPGSGVSPGGPEALLPVVIGTAGHIDHGKTTLIRALTGVDTDRLAEEKRRGLTIDLGFAPFRLPSGRVASVVDVPGHEKFLKNMLAGVTGMDLVLLVVAADDGVMPQTREHLAILSLLAVPRGIVVVTKTDLVDPELLALACEDIQATLAGTFLEGAPLVPVSAQTGAGLEALVAEIERMALSASPRDPLGAARMPIDRVFMKQGFGTVVTGTLVSGTLREGDAITLMPSGATSRVRSLQVHGGKRDQVPAGTRVAVNLAGIERGDLARGEWLLGPDSCATASGTIDAWIALLPDARPLAHRTRVRFHHGAGETIGRVALLDREELAPGDGGFARILLETEVAADFGDRFVLRRYSPGETIAGGRVLHPAPTPLRRGKARQAIARLAAAYEGRWREALSLWLEEAGDVPALRTDLLAQAPRSEGEAALAALVSEGQVVERAGTYLAASRWQARESQLLAVLKAHHQAHPSRIGMTREALQAALPVPLSLLIALLEAGLAQGKLRQEGAFHALADWRPKLSLGDQVARQRIVERLMAGGLVAETEIVADLPPPQARATLEDLVQGGTAVRLGGGIYADPQALDQIRGKLRANFEGTPFTASQAREALNTSRKYAIPLLEFLDASGFTRRQGDMRVLVAPKGG